MTDIVPQVRALLTEENYEGYYLRFGDRQAGVSLIYAAEENRYYYNAYCLEITLLKELFSVEYEFLDDALATVNGEFGTWELVPYVVKSGCDTCVAK